MVVVVVGCGSVVRISSGSKVVVSCSVVGALVVDVLVGGDTSKSLSMLLIVLGELLCLAPVTRSFFELIIVKSPFLPRIRLFLSAGFTLKEMGEVFIGRKM